MLRQAAEAAHRIFKGLFRSEGQENISTPPEETALFRLLFGALLIGTLELREGIWEFKYSDAFKEQLKRDGGVQPLVDFPDPYKSYRSEELAPFFMARIPSLSQPRVLEEVERRGLDQTNALQLLRAFGERSIANPFVLRSA